MSRKHVLRLIALILLASASAAGCASCRIPAIDPTGARIFSGTTTLTSPSDCPLVPRLPNPAWRAAPYAPPCGTGPLAIVQPVATSVPIPVDPCPDAYAPDLTVTPQRFVAPVGSDVVLVAGMCGKGGHHGKKHFYEMRQPLEWMLAPEGVGYIVEVGKENCPLTRLVSTTPNKINTTYAKAHTSTIRQVITRGTGRVEDDVELAKGQSWISVSSPNEGVSYVTVLAPAENNWEQRKETATIYWVDAKWTFPAPVVVKPETPHRLTTKVIRSNGMPVPGWIVRYDILEGPPASFGAANQQSIEVTTDINGEANVELLPQTKDAGISQIRVQVVRPDPTKPAEPPMLVGQGFTQVQWSTPGLVVRGEATQRTGADGVINYALQVVNNGDQLTRDVVLSFTPPQGVSITGSTIPAQPFGERLQWPMGNLAPGETKTLNIIAKAAMPGDFQSCFTARSAEHLDTPPTCFTTNVAGSALRINVQEPANLNVTVGDLVQYRVQVTNTSNAVIPGVRIVDQFDQGLEHYDSTQQQLSGQTSPIDRDPINLQAGETHQFALTFRVGAPGQICHRLDIQADNGQRFSQQYCVRAVGQGGAAVPGPAIPGPGPAVPDFGPLPVAAAGMMRVTTLAKFDQIREGEKVDFMVEVTNAGATALTNVRLEMEPSKGLSVTDASRDFERLANNVGFYWTVARLEPGKSESRVITCVAQAQGKLGVRGVGLADGLESQSQEAQINVLPGTPAEPDPLPRDGAALNPPMPVNPASTVNKPAGSLKVVLDRNSNPVRLNKDVTFTVDITNLGEGPDQNVAIELKLPAGLKFVKVSESPARVSGVSEDARAVDLEAIQEVRAREKLATSKFVVQGMTPGEYVVQVHVFSASHPDGISKETTLSVLAR